MNNKLPKIDPTLTREVDISQRKHVINWKKLIATTLIILVLAGMTIMIVFLAGIAKS